MSQHNTTMTFDEDQKMIMDAAMIFCRTQSPIEAVRGLLSSEAGFAADTWQEQVELGWPGLTLPEQYGGLGLGPGVAVSVAEAMGRHLLATPFISCTLAAQAILRSGSEAQREAWLPAIIEGKIATLALLDDEDWGGSLTRAKLSPDGDDYVLNGSKGFVTDAITAEIFIVTAQIDDEAVLVVVPREDVSTLTPQVLIDETKRAARVDFSGARVSDANVLRSGNIPGVISDLCLLGAMLTAAEAAGSATACLNTIVEYLNTREQFGRLIGSYQSLKHTTVNILTEIDSARSHLYHAATLVSNSALDRDAEIACRMAKSQATDALTFAGDRAVQFHGGMGFTYECDAQLYIRRAQWTQQVFGDSYHHRKRLAGLLLD